MVMTLISLTIPEDRIIRTTDAVGLQDYIRNCANSFHTIILSLTLIKKDRMKKVTIFLAYYIERKDFSRYILANMGVRYRQTTNPTS